MDKRVYLFELDSVRKTDEEILKGQYALYDELFGNSNTVVLSMNQITDSKAILCMLYKKETYEVLKQYLTNGLIRISRYGSIRTTSQYLQNAINKNLSNNKDVFIFSALPVKSNQKRLLLLMREVLINADLSVIKEYTSQTRYGELIGLFDEFDDNDSVRENTVTEEQARKYLKILYRFLEMVLLISMYDKSANPAIEYSDEAYKIRDFLKIMNFVLAFQSPECETKLWVKSTDILRQIMVRAKKEPKIYQDRSVWIKELYKRSLSMDAAMKTPLQYAEMIVNLCYNYTVEYSILGSSKHYDLHSLNEQGAGSFETEFLTHLAYDWENGISPDKRFLQKESNEFQIYDGGFPEWKKGDRIIKRRMLQKRENRLSENIALYEYDYFNRRKVTRKRDILNIFKVILVTCIYVAAMIVMDRLMTHVQDFVGEVIKSSVTFLVIIIISACIDRIVPIPDIIDCVRMFLTSALDFHVIMKQKTIAYLNRRNFRVDIKDKVPPQAVQRIYLNQSLLEYKMLAKERPNLFQPSQLLPIINPLDPEGEKEILKYEMVHNVRIGVNYKSRFHMLVVDLVKGNKGELYTYERLVPTVAEGAVVVIPEFQGKYILLSQFRHAMREMQIGFPRGFGELDKDGTCLSRERNACKEICEELGIDENHIEQPEYLGEVIADSGVNGNKVSVYKVRVDIFQIQTGYEGIQDVLLMSGDELQLAIKNGEINDGFTLAAWSLRDVS